MLAIGSPAIASHAGRECNTRTMPRRRSRTGTTDADAAAPILFVDAGLASGWRRAALDLAQLDEVLDAARQSIPDCVVLADASLKWSLPSDQQDRFEELRASAQVLCAPGGTKGGHHEFFAAAARAAAGSGRDVWVLCGLDLGSGPWRVARLRRPDGAWVIEMPDD